MTLTPTAKRVSDVLRRWGVPEALAPQATADVFRALEKPDKAMLKAAAKAMSPDYRPTQRTVSVQAKHGIRWRAMVRAAIGQFNPVRSTGLPNTES